jgi:hypothetical protein
VNRPQSPAHVAVPSCPNLALAVTAQPVPEPLPPEQVPQPLDISPSAVSIVSLPVAL